MRRTSLAPAGIALLVLALAGGCTTGTPAPAPAPTGTTSAPVGATAPSNGASTSSQAVSSKPVPGVSVTTPAVSSSTSSRPKVFPDPNTTVTEPAPKGLPRGGTTIFPTYRLVGWVGYPGSPGLGRLGDGNINERVPEMVAFSKDWAHGRQVLPVVEQIVTLVHEEPQDDGTFRTQVPDGWIAAWLNAARKNKAILLLNIQPGRAKFVDEVKRLEKWLKEPDVGLALDPEWAVGPTQTPGKVFGSTSGDELEEVASYLADIVQKNGLPEKVMVYHVLRPQIARKEADLKQHKGVVLVKSADGIGLPVDKIAKYKLVTDATKANVHMGFKIFWTDKRENPQMTAEQVFALKPEPEYVMFE